MPPSLSFRRLANTSLTIYNKYIDARAEKYQRTQIVNADGSNSAIWESRQAGTALQTGGVIAADEVAIMLMLESGVNYLEPKAWQALVNKAGKWTLQLGDFIVKGLVTDEIVLPTFTPAMLKARYENVLAITSVAPMTLGRLQHWEIIAK